MLSVIKTAIITIIISFISGVLLDSYKNFAPRILCTMGKPIPLKIKDRRIRAFTLIIRNISNKTIHNLNLNIQGHYDNLKIDDARITKGLKFETSSEDNNYNVSIPFLSKNDEFSVKVFVDSFEGAVKKPIVTLRSPEDFKRVDSSGKNGYLATLAGIPKDISDSFTKKNNRNQRTDVDNNRVYNKENGFSKHKKALITAVGILIVIYAGILGTEYYNKVAGKATTSNDKTNIQNTGASFGTSSKTTEEDTSSTTASTSSTPAPVTSKSSSESGSSNDKNDTSVTKSSGDTSSVSGKSSTSGTNKNTKSSADSSSKNSNIDSEKSESTENSTKNSETNSNKTSSTEADETDTSTSDNKQSEPKTSIKAPTENTAEQETSKTPNSNTSPANSPSSPEPVTK
ncbi:MAG: hypothetical protein Q4F66_00820 [Clostridium sp.]|nr:hypothetical protein [Clostridium sp.]